MPAALNPSLKTQAIELLGHGLTPGQAAAKLGLSRSTVKNWFNQPHVIAAKDIVHTLVKAELETQVNQALAKQSDNTRTALANEIESAANTLAKAPALTVHELLDNEGRTSRIAGVKTLAEAASTVFGWSKGGGANGLSSLRRFDEAIDVTPCESTDAPVSEPKPCMDIKLTSIDDSPKPASDSTLEK